MSEPTGAVRIRRARSVEADDDFDGGGLAAVDPESVFFSCVEGVGVGDGVLLAFGVGVGVGSVAVAGFVTFFAGVGVSFFGEDFGTSLPEGSCAETTISERNVSATIENIRRLTVIFPRFQVAKKSLTRSGEDIKRLSYRTNTTKSCFFVAFVAPDNTAVG